MLHSKRVDFYHIILSAVHACKPDLVLMQLVRLINFLSLNLWDVRSFDMVSIFTNVKNETIFNLLMV